MSSILDGIKGANDMHVTPYEVPEWGVTVYLRPLSNGDADTFSQIAGEGASGKKPGHAMAMTLALMMCDENGKKLWSKPDDGVKVLQEKNSAVVQRIFSKAMEVAGNKDSIEQTGKG